MSDSVDQKTPTRLVVNVRPEELDAIRRAASDEGEVVSVWVRARLREALARAARTRT